MSYFEVPHSGLHDLVAPDAPIERVAGGLSFTEGPVWRGGALLFSDIPNQRIVRWRRLPRRPGADHLRYRDVQWPDLGPPGPGASGRKRAPLREPRGGQREPHRAGGAVSGQATQ